MINDTRVGNEAVIVVRKSVAQVMGEREPRHPANKAVRVFQGNKACRAHLVDVNASGACLGGMGQPARNTQVTVCYMTLCIRARVAWTKGGLTGVQFAARLPAENLQALRGALSWSMHEADDIR